jgi:uncharacterized protein (TIGR04255 family)
MFGKIADPDDRPFPGSAPVQLAVFQLDFEEERASKSKDGIRWKELLQQRGFRVPRLSAVKQQSMTVQMGGTASPQTNVDFDRRGWQAILDDGDANASVYPTGVRFERVKYPGFERFRKELLDVMDALRELLEPEVQTRLSLTFSNALSDAAAETASFWRGKVRPNFLGAAQDDGLTEELKQGFMGCTFEHADFLVDFRSSIQPDQVHIGRVAFVFQTEVIQQGIRSLDIAAVKASLEDAHVIALKMFYSVLDPAFIRQLRGVEEA